MSADKRIAELEAEVERLTDVVSWDEHLLSFSRWIDAGSTLGDEAQQWHRVAKVAEEAGEAVGALLGYTGANPRKGFTHDLDQLDSELMQTALSALGASAHLHGNEPEYSPFTRLRLQLARDMSRVGLDLDTTAGEPYVERITDANGDEQERGGDTDLQATIAALIEAGDMRVFSSPVVLIDGERFRQAWIRDVT